MTNATHTLYNLLKSAQAHRATHPRLDFPPSSLFLVDMQQRREEGLARIAHLQKEVSQREGLVAALAAANAQLRQQLAPPLAPDAARQARCAPVAMRTLTQPICPALATAICLSDMPLTRQLWAPADVA